jgi:signal transduction histidine kinase
MTDAEEPAALRRENNILREILDALDATVVVYDAERRYVMANRAYHEHFPHLPDDSGLVGQRYEDILARAIAAGAVTDQQASRDPQGFIAHRLHVVTTRNEQPRETYNEATGKWHLMRVRHTPAGNRVALRVDITEQKRIQAELQQAREAAEVASRAKSRFLAHVSHELRTPLNAVINFARLIEEFDGTPSDAAAGAEYARDIRQSGEHLLTLINQLLDFAQTEADRVALTEAPVNLRRLLRSVYRTMRPAAFNRVVTLLCDVPERLPDVRADHTRLRQVLFNLVSNAIKFSDPGGIVRLSASTEDGGVLLSVADTGCGIAAEDLPRVMLPFERAAGSAAHRPGIGLGLPLAAHFVALHDGRLSLDSTPGAGTVARVFLPAERVLAPALHSV